MSRDHVAQQQLRINRPSPVHRYDALRSELKIPKAWQDPHLPIDTSKLPKLLVINDSTLRDRAVTHSTVFTDTLSHDPLRMQEKINASSYEALEMLGDRYMGACAALALFKKVPGLSPSRITELNTILLSNRTISYLSYHYKLHERLKLGTNFPRDSNNYNQKTSADLFEAHVGGLLLEADKNGSDRRIRDWLADVFDLEVFPTLEEGLKRRKEEAERSLLLSKRSKRKALNQNPSLCPRCDHLNTSRTTVEYSDIHSRQWHARVLREGIEMGCGSGCTKLEAHDEALSNAMTRAVRGSL